MCVYVESLRAFFRETDGPVRSAMLIATFNVVTRVGTIWKLNIYKDFCKAELLN